MKKMWILLIALVLISAVSIAATGEEAKFKVKAIKIVCDSESDLPNWGGGGPNIHVNTVPDFLAAHPNCHPEPGWYFQVAPGGASNPGDNTGAAGGPWTTFGPTDAEGKTSIFVPYENQNRVWVREVWNNEYIPFTGVGGSDVSAEFYCYHDVLHYDNYEYILGPEIGHSYQCVGFNVKAAQCGDGFCDMTEYGYCPDDCGELVPPPYRPRDGCIIVESYAYGEQNQAEFCVWHTYTDLYVAGEDVPKSSGDPLYFVGNSGYILDAKHSPKTLYEEKEFQVKYTGDPNTRFILKWDVGQLDDDFHYRIDCGGRVYDMWNKNWFILKTDGAGEKTCDITVSRT